MVNVTQLSTRSTQISIFVGVLCHLQRIPLEWQYSRKRISKAFSCSNPKGPFGRENCDDIFFTALISSLFNLALWVDLGFTSPPCQNCFLNIAPLSLSSFLFIRVKWLFQYLYTCSGTSVLKKLIQKQNTLKYFLFLINFLGRTG